MTIRKCTVLGVAGLFALSLSVLASSLPAVAQAPAPGATNQAAPGLIEESTFLNVRGPAGSYRLEAVVVRPAQAQGRLPIALITHGKPRLSSEMAQIRADLLARSARDLAYRGYLAVGVIRRGYGRSDGTPGVATNAPYAKCTVADLQKYFEVEADDLEAALRAVQARPDADPTRGIVIGGSVGGGAALALAARKPAGLSAAINIAGGVRLTNAQGEVVCPYETPIAAIGQLGAGSRIPTLWIYSENDGIFAPDIARRAHAAYKAAGGNAELQPIPAIDADGHHALQLPAGRVHWLAAADRFLRANSLPTWTATDVDRAMRKAAIQTGSRGMVEKYFSLYTPRVMLQAPDGRVTYVADTRSLDAARASGLASCEKWAKAPCRVIMENFSAAP